MRKYSRSNAHQGLRDRLANVASDYRADLRDGRSYMDQERAAWYTGYMSAVLGAIKNELDHSYSNGRDWQSAFQDYKQAQDLKLRLLKRSQEYFHRRDEHSALVMSTDLFLTDHVGAPERREVR